MGNEVQTKGPVDLRTVNDAQHREVIKNYRAGKTWKEIRESLNVSNGYISKVLNLYDEPKLRKQKESFGRLDSDNEQKIVTDYVENDQSIEALASSYDSNEWTIRTILSNHGVQIKEEKPRSSRATVDEDVFDAPYSSEAAYWAGYLCRRGVSTSAPSNVLRVHMRDYHHLKALKRFLGAKTNIRKIDSTFALNFASAKLKKMFSEAAEKAKLVDKFRGSRFFWRGVLDSSSSWSLKGEYNNPVITLTGEPFLIKEFIDFVQRTVDVQYDPAVAETSGGNYQVGVGSDKAFRLIQMLYGKDRDFLMMPDRAEQSKEWMEDLAKKYVQDVAVPH